MARISETSTSIESTTDFTNYWDGAIAFKTREFNVLQWRVKFDTPYYL